MRTELINILNGGDFNGLHLIVYKEFCNYAKPEHRNFNSYETFVSNAINIRRVNANIFVRECIDEMICKYGVNLLKDKDGNLIKYT